MKNEKLIVPKDLGRFFEENESNIGNSKLTFKMINNLTEYYGLYEFEFHTMTFISKNINDIIEVIKGEMEYEIEEEEFYAMIKGWEKAQGNPHWAYNERNDEFTINYYIGYQGLDIKMTIAKWNELGINDSNAEFLTSLD